MSSFTHIRTSCLLHKSFVRVVINSKYTLVHVVISFEKDWYVKVIIFITCMVCTILIINILKALLFHLIYALGCCDCAVESGRNDEVKNGISFARFLQCNKRTEKVKCCLLAINNMSKQLYFNVTISITFVTL